jgi:hypothetical protein
VRKAFFGSLTALLLAGSFAVAQAPLPEVDAGAARAGVAAPRAQPALPALPSGEGDLVLGPGPVSDPAPALAPTPFPGSVPGPSLPTFYLNAEYLLWWTKAQQLPPLVTTGSLSDDFPGALGQPSTVELIGNSNVNDRMRSGAQFTGGFWLNRSETIGVEGSFFFLQPQSSHLSASSDGSTLLALPYFAAGTVTNPDGTTQDLAQEQALLVASPGTSAGSVNVATSSHFWGAEANGRMFLCGDCTCRVDLLAGFRYLNISDSLSVLSVSNSIPPGSSTTVSDVFNSRNQFYGGQIGIVADYWSGPWFLDIRGKLALGSITRTADIGGSTTFTTAGGSVVVPGGLFAQPTNIGHYTSTAFGVVPQVGVRLGYQITSYLRAYVGYSLIYLVQSVARPADQIDRSVNVTQVPALGQGPLAGDLRPAFAFQSTDFWAQGFLAGLELDF